MIRSFGMMVYDDETDQFVGNQSQGSPQTDEAAALALAEWAAKAKAAADQLASNPAAAEAAAAAYQKGKEAAQAADATQASIDFAAGQAAQAAWAAEIKRLKDEVAAGITSAAILKKAQDDAAKAASDAADGINIAGFNLSTVMLIGGAAVFILPQIFKKR